MLIHSIYGEDISLVEEWISLNSNSSIIEWKFTTQRVKSRPVHSIFTPKKWSLTSPPKEWQYRVNRVIFFREYTVYIMYTQKDVIIIYELQF